jgi:hypothetical protein
LPPARSIASFAPRRAKQCPWTIEDFSRPQVQK